MRQFIYSFAFFACLYVFVACSSGNDTHLAGMWKVESYADPFKATLGATFVEPDAIYILRLNDTGLFSFTTDCNTISGEYSVKGRDLQFENLSATELACDKEILERSIKSQLPMVVSYDLPNDSTLCLLGRQGNVLVRLIRVNVTTTNPNI